ncbi:AraC family transcriptional regulator [Paenibacillus oenotherae]|uniref:AraC family transcriptional regulator n=1 Tax=Paenibacillus oenotherae TaxID=1435645 RepID=A0ABS7DBE7_9BACL|nr:AraC family transcriptional regulator [Paenibacillus oenotherae]MBW7477262.1 AraC family transcriptional regulator [Paenibacillus oenotherae]
MKAMRKHFMENDEFPLQFVYRDTKSPQSELPEHVHDWNEIVYVYSGRGTFFIDSLFFEMRAGDIFLLPGDTIHHAVPDKSNPVTSSVVYFGRKLIPELSLGESFSLPALFDNIRQSGQYRVTLNEADRASFMNGIERIHEEVQSRQQGNHFAIRLILHQLLLELSRSQQLDFEEMRSPAQGSPYPWLQETLLYIDTNPELPLTLSLLAKRALVSREHLSRVFKDMTGMKLTDYIHAKKILHAKQLLIHTTASIEEIAERCGFETLTHFHRVFKKRMEMTPAVFRKQSSTAQAAIE